MRFELPRLTWERGPLARIRCLAGGTPALPLLLLALFLLLATAARAQSVRWEPSESGLANSVQLVFENCSPDGEPQLPSIPGVTFTQTGRSNNTSIVNFQMTQSVVITYFIRGRSSGPLTIPAFTVRTNKGPMRVDAYNAAAPAAPLDSVASARLLPERNSVWAGEVFGLTYELSASRRANPQISPTFDWNAAPLVAEDWSKPEVTEAVVNGERRAQVIFRTRVFAKSPNMLKLEAAVHMLDIQTGTIGFGIISQPRMERVSVTSDQPVVEVKPLPTPPPGFSGAVGRFQLVSKVVPENAAVGEPVTWTLELSGLGNWPDIAGLPAREVSNDFQVVQPKAKRTPAGGKLFDVSLSEDVVLVPTRAGTYTLGPVSFVYFDPGTGRYETKSAPRTTVTIAAPAAPQVPTGIRSTDPGRTEAATEHPEPRIRGSVTAPPPPAAIPRDPLPGSAGARVPMRPAALTLQLLPPVAGLLLVWFLLALRRAKATDPVRPRREARARLARTLAHVNTAHDDAERARLLLAWQRDTAVLWQIAHAAPSADAFDGAAAPAARSEASRGEGAAAPDSAAWAALWAEADRALYGARPALPSDWVARAQEALAARRVPGFKPGRLFLPQNLMPFAAMLAVLLVTSSALLHAAEKTPNSKLKSQSRGEAAAAAYRKGDFTAAAKAWQTRIAAAPTDWIARHNLSLALAQLERTGESAAHAAAAFVQNPSAAAVRWHFGLAAERSGAAPAELSGFFNPGPLHALGRQLSPANWQLVMLGGAWTAALALAWWLANAYGRNASAIAHSALGLLVLSAAAIATSATGVHSYRDAANASAMVVARPSTLRSIPTEADTSQKTSPLSVGSMAIGDRTFLGWTRLAFANGQTGWVRTEDLVGLWK